MHRPGLTVPSSAGNHSHSKAAREINKQCKPEQTKDAAAGELSTTTAEEGNEIFAREGGESKQGTKTKTDS